MRERQDRGRPLSSTRVRPPVAKLTNTYSVPTLERWLCAYRVRLDGWRGTYVKVLRALALLGGRRSRVVGCASFSLASPVQPRTAAKNA